MAQQVLNNTNVEPDSLKTATDKINSNFEELYARVGGSGAVTYVLNRAPESPADNHIDGDFTLNTATTPPSLYAQIDSTWTLITSGSADSEYIAAYSFDILETPNITLNKVLKNTLGVSPTITWGGTTFVVEFPEGTFAEGTMNDVYNGSVGANTHRFWPGEDPTRGMAIVPGLTTDSWELVPVNAQGYEVALVLVVKKFS